MDQRMPFSALDGLLRRRFSRRELILGSGVLALGHAAGCSTRVPGAAIAGSREDRVIVPEGYAVDVLLRWGDPVVAGAAALPVEAIADGSLLEPGAASTQARTFGASADGMGVIPLDDSRLLICVNHETPEMSRMFPAWTAALRARQAPEFIRDNPEAVALMRASVGVSVLEFMRDGTRWRMVGNSPLNRRITADTPMVFAGPAASHPWLGGSASAVGTVLGTLGNCAAGATPWGTYLTAEENTNDFFGNGAQAEFEPLLARATERFSYRRGVSAYRWELVDDRFDHAKYPSESMKFGWIVEIDPRDPERAIKKRTALGRFRHEGATVTLNAERRPVVYLGDDSQFEYFYKFVSSRTYDPDDRENNDRLLDDGTLYVARLNDDGNGEWLPLVFGQHPALTEANDFNSQADVVLRCREAADLVGATPLDRPEDVAVNPRDGRVYLACTMGADRGAESAPGVDAANPRGPNPFGHILEFTEAGADPAAERFAWEVFLLAGDPQASGLAPVVAPGRMTSIATYFAGQTEVDRLSPFAAPDNLGFDEAGNLWIVTDGAQPRENNNGCFVCATDGPDRGAVRQFMSGPVGAEISGCTFSPDGKTLFLTVQHPGSGSPIEAPSSHWPDGNDSQPRSSLIAIQATDAARIFGT